MNQLLNGLKLFSVGLMTVALGTALLLIPAAPAHAVRACTAYAICFYDVNTSLASPIEERDWADTSPNECHNMPSAARNKTSYVQNRTDSKWYAFRSLDCGGPAGSLYADTNGAMTGVWNNSIKSYKRA